MVSHGMRVSASVIISLKSLVNSLNLASIPSKNVKKVESGLKVLTLRRGQKDRLLPGADVFPGGNIEPSDFSSEWLDLYEANGFTKESFHKLSLASCSLWSSERIPEVKDGLPPWLGFRISAIRETFEECGILLCCSSGGTTPTSPWTSYTILHDVESWQKRVRAEPLQLLALCESKGCVPDVWGLHLWSNWLTPPDFHMRHNTVFFLAVLHSEPPHFLDLREMDQLMWRTPDELIEGAASGTVSFVNPQIYETLRLAQFSRAESLAEFAASRSTYGCEVLMPIKQKARDGTMFILPGDSEYPEQPEYDKKRDIVQLDCTIDGALQNIRLRQGSLHRIAQRNDKFYVLIHNYSPPYRHVLPISEEISWHPHKL